MKINPPKSIIAVAAMILVSTTLLSAQGGFNGAIYTTVSDGTGVDVNIYDNKADVYLNGGPQNTNANGLPNGTYYYQVTDPSGGTLLSTDPARCRQLTVSGGRISGALPQFDNCHHANGTQNTANNSIAVQLVPFNDTPNNGGEYKVWLIRQATTTVIVGDQMTSPVLNFTNNNVKTDNFRIRDFCEVNPNDPSCNPTPPDVFLSGHKFYDADADAVFDAGEVPVAGVRIVISYATPAGTFGPFTATTDANGDWTYGPIPAGAAYNVFENVPFVDDNGDQIPDAGHYWVQTAPAADSTGFQGYTGVAAVNVTGLNFGNVCFGPASGGLTLGYWSNKNGQRTMTLGGAGVDVAAYPRVVSPNIDGVGMEFDLAFLRRLNLRSTNATPRNPDGTHYDPTDYNQFRNWLLNGNAVNMAYMLSVQLSASSLDVRHFALRDSQIVDARTVCNSLGSCLNFTSIGLVRFNADQALSGSADIVTLSGDPRRESQEQMKNFLDDVNNNRLPFASSTPCSVFYPL